MDNSIYRWVKASEIKIDYRKKYFAKRADDETIMFTGRFQESDGVFFWEGHPGYVPMRKDQYDILLILEEVKETDQQELWDKIAQRMYHENDDEEWLEQNFFLIPKQ